MLERSRGRPGRAADRRRAAGLHLERRGRGRPPGQPGPGPLRGHPGRRRGLPVDPGADHRLPPGAVAWWRKGFSMHGEPVTIEGSELLARAIQHETDHLDGVLFLDRLDAANRKLAMKAIRESEWFGLEQPTVKVSPHAPSGSASSEGRLRRARRSRRWPSLDAIAASPHELVGVVTRPDAPAGRGRRLTPSPVGRARRRARRPRPQAGPPARPGVPGGAAGAGARLLPGRRVRRPAPAVRARHPDARLGEPALLGAARVARRRARPARPVGRRRGHRCDDLPDRPRAGRRADVRVDDRAGAPGRHRRRPAGAAGRGRRRPAGGHPRRSRDGTLEAREQPEDGIAFAPKITVEDAHVDWTEPAMAVDRRIRACTPAPGAWTTYEGERVKLGPVTPADGALPPGELLVGKNAVAVGTGHGRAQARAGQGVRQEGDAGRRLGPRDPRRTGRPLPVTRVGNMARSRKARPEDVDEICAALPETELGISWGDRPTWKVPRGPKGKGFLLYRAPGQNADRPGDRGGVRRPDRDHHPDRGREARPGARTSSTPFFTIPHFDGYSAVLVQQSRLGELTRQEL